MNMFTKMIQTYGEENRQCPKCFCEEYEVDLKTIKNDLLSRRCKRCNHEWLDTTTIKEWQKLKRMEGAKRRGNLNQHIKRQPSRIEACEY